MANGKRMGRPRSWTWTPEECERLVRECGGVTQALRQAGIPKTNFFSWLKDETGDQDEKRRYREAIARGRGEAFEEKQKSQVQPDFAERVHNALKKLPKARRISVEGLADRMDVSPKRVREALDTLRDRGFAIPTEDEHPDGNVALERIRPAKNNVHKVLFDGELFRFGVVSDTHLSSNEEALDELHQAYDLFAEEGITEVYHAGDWTCGRGIYRTQDMEIKNHTYQSQVDYLTTNYPERKNIRTRGISGNHDIEGEFGRIGADPVMALALKRDDIDYLGPYSAWIELPNESYMHLLHGKGGGSYAFSYQAQRFAESYSGGRKPVILVPGHFHRKGNIETRGVEVVWPGCFEYKSFLLERLGLSPAVGFWIFEGRLGDDGSLVRFKPEWFRFFEGRVVR